MIAFFSAGRFNQLCAPGVVDTSVVQAPRCVVSTTPGRTQIKGCVCGPVCCKLKRGGAYTVPSLAPADTDVVCCASLRGPHLNPNPEGLARGTGFARSVPAFTHVFRASTHAHARAAAALLTARCCGTGCGPPVRTSRSHLREAKHTLPRGVRASIIYVNYLCSVRIQTCFLRVRGLTPLLTLPNVPAQGVVCLRAQQDPGVGLGLGLGLRYSMQCPHSDMSSARAYAYAIARSAARPRRRVWSACAHIKTLLESLFEHLVVVFENVSNMREATRVALISQVHLPKYMLNGADWCIAMRSRMFLCNVALRALEPYQW
eukprot:TRINITY_DN10810_c0_g1_i1.p1 TRINITY_DN10810_c0_g1~~TRINITY_DN10810_c0_g1_i1.p1  ORF type:complete len:317 (+),score=4.84 TRINITY_DN10810_c0_g1_i1:335-1285(+)